MHYLSARQWGVLQITIGIRIMSLNGVLRLLTTPQLWLWHVTLGYSTPQYMTYIGTLIVTTHGQDYCSRRTDMFAAR